MNVECLLIETWIILVTEIASLIIRGLLLLLLLLLVLLLLRIDLLSFNRRSLHLGVRSIIVPTHCLLTFILLVFFIILAYLMRCLLFCSGSTSFLAGMRINICHYGLFRGCLFHLRGTTASVNFSKCSFKCFYLRGSQLTNLLTNVGSYKSIELAHALVGDIPHILKVVLDSLKRKGNCTLDK